MTNNQLTDERISDISDYFVEMQDHYSDPADRENFEIFRDAELLMKELQERRKAERGSEPVAWINGCNKSVPSALRYLAENPRPIGGESSFNTVHLYQLAREIELMAEAPLYRHAQQPVVPDESYQQLSDLYHAQEKRLFKIAQRIKGPAFDKYSHSPSQAIDVLEETMRVLVKYYRWLAAHSEPHPKPEVYATDWDSCRKRDDEYQKLKASGIDFSNASMMISGCSSEHSDIPNGGNYPVIPGAKQRIADAVELLKQAAPAMLADNGGPDGPLAGRLKSPVIPDSSASMLRRWLAFGRGMQNAGSQLPHNLIAETESMLAAAAQPQNSPQNIPEIIPGWVPVSERMPEERETVVLVADERGVVWCAEVQDGEIYPDEFPGTRGFGCAEATHWMPLPAAPQEMEGR